MQEAIKLSDQITIVVPCKNEENYIQGFVKCRNHRGRSGVLGQEPWSTIGYHTLYFVH